MRSKWSYSVALLVLVAAAAAVGRANWNARQTAGAARRERPALEGTSRQGLARTIAAASARLQADPTDAEAAVALADALMRQARVSGDAGLALRAEAALVQVLRDDPALYDARRMLATVYLSEHRFREAIREAERASRERPTDDWNFGVAGDGHLELGEYEQAFEAFQRMIDLRPTAGAYARVAYALELRGRLADALEAMQLSTDATPPSDVESLAWHHAQVGDLYRQLGRNNEASLQYRWAQELFPNHPFARRGLALLKEQEGDLANAARMLGALLADTPSPDVAEKLGDVYTALGRQADAARAYAEAERGWRFDAPNPAMLARFLADHGRQPGDAVAVAERAAADRQDIFTEDALAWSYFRAGRLREAAASIARATRTGTRDRTIVEHAAAIRRAVHAAATP